MEGMTWTEKRSAIAQYMFQEQGYDEGYAYVVADEILILIGETVSKKGEVK